MSLSILFHLINALLGYELWLPSNGACEPGMQSGLKINEDPSIQVADSRHVQKLRAEIATLHGFDWIPCNASNRFCNLRCAS